MTESTSSDDISGGQNQKQWLIALNNDALNTSGNDDNDPVFVKLRNPKTDESTMFLFCNKNTKVFEVCQFKEDFRSWIIGQDIQQDGSMMITTPVDPLFLALPYFTKASKNGKYMTLDQIIVDEDYPECDRLCEALRDISCIADVKGDDDFQAFRYNKDSTLLWLQKKVDRLAKKLEEKEIVVTGDSRAASYVKKGTPEEFVHFAHGMVSDYLPSDISQDLKDFMGIKAIVHEKPSIEEPDPKRPKTEKGGVLEDYSQGVLKDESNKKAGKMTVAQKKLSKVDKGSMKSISSFFSPKAKK